MKGRIQLLYGSLLLLLMGAADPRAMKPPPPRETKVTEADPAKIEREIQDLIDAQKRYDEETAQFQQDVQLLVERNRDYAKSPLRVRTQNAKPACKGLHHVIAMVFPKGGLLALVRHEMD